MNESSIWAIAALLFAALIAVFSLLTEKKEREIHPSWLRRCRRPILYSLSVAALVVGVGQIRKTDREAHEADTKHAIEHNTDQQKISGLQDSVNMLTKVNEIQYERNRDELVKLRDQVNDLKLAKLTEEDRKKIATLETQLDKALAPKPRANLQFSFDASDLNKGEVRSTLYVPIDEGVIKFGFVTENNTEINAPKVTVWVRACLECKFHREPPGAIKVPGAMDIERIYQIEEIQPGVAIHEPDVEVEVPQWMTRMPISFDFRCADCELEKEWQNLWVNVGRIPTPQFSTPTSTSKKPKKS